VLKTVHAFQDLLLCSRDFPLDFASLTVQDSFLANSIVTLVYAVISQE